MKYLGSGRFISMKNRNLKEKILESGLNRVSFFLDDFIGGIT
jgi:hypothetical protein